MLIDISSYKYLPLLSVRYSEMLALENLSNKDKDLILPIFSIRGWAGSHNLSNSIERIEKSFGKRVWIGDIDEDYYLEKKSLLESKKKPVHKQIEALKDPADGYKKWHEFVADNPQIIPCLQLEDVRQLDAQINRFISLNRGIAVRFNESNIASWNAILGVLSTKEIDALYVIVDYGKSGQKAQSELLTYAASVIGFIKSMAQLLPDATYIISSTTFPAEFSDIEGIGEKFIYERQFFNMIIAQSPDVELIYSDRGSVKAEHNTAGWTGSPRIDYPLKNSWKISREKVKKKPTKEENEKERRAGFRKAAKAIVADPAWEPTLQVWGAKEIEAASKADHITDARHSTAVRINIHLHRQAHYDAPLGTIIDTDDDWVD